MTADKMLKRLIRARSARTGESYVVARRHLLAKRGGGSGEMQEVVRYTDDEYGFSLSVPYAWERLDPDKSNSPFEVARFLHIDDAERRGALVFVRQEGADTALAATVAETRSILASAGFREFDEVSMTVAGREGTRLRSETQLGEKTWTIFHHFVAGENETYVLLVGSTTVDADADILCDVADSFAVRHSAD